MQRSRGGPHGSFVPGDVQPDAANPPLPRQLRPVAPLAESPTRGAVLRTHLQMRDGESTLRLTDRSRRIHLLSPQFIQRISELKAAGAATPLSPSGGSRHSQCRWLVQRTKHQPHTFLISTRRNPEKTLGPRIIEREICRGRAHSRARECALLAQRKVDLAETQRHAGAALRLLDGA